MTRRIGAILVWTFLSWQTFMGAPSPPYSPAWALRERVVLPTQEDCEAVANWLMWMVNTNNWGSAPTPCLEETDATLDRTSSGDGDRGRVGGL